MLCRRGGGGGGGVRKLFSGFPSKIGYWWTSGSNLFF